jgi:hypothetical protein
MSAGAERRRFGVLFLAFGLLAGSAQAGVRQAWVQYGAAGTPEVRVVVDDAVCPTLTVDGQPLATAERRAPDSAFPVRVCAVGVPGGARSLSVGSLTLPVPVGQPKRIVVIGDTGCRIKGLVLQACNDAREWPFAKVAEQAAREHPDLVIHVGDYLYRESACPPGVAGCKDSPWGDNATTWEADFFQPAAPLLKAAVWLAERGNHEECARAGRGWTAYLGRDPVSAPCSPADRPLLADVGGLRIGVLDDNDAADGDAKEALVTRLRGDVEALLAAKPDWVVTHHPWRGVVSTHLVGNTNLDRAAAGLPEDSVGLLLSGHIHNFQAINFVGDGPPQLVVGEGGDKLDTGIPATLTGLKMPDATIKDGLSLGGFGYVVMTRLDKGWAIEAHSVDGALLKRCRLTDRVIACGDTP